MSANNPKSLTMRQKLRAMAHRFYQHAAWHPQAGDYYTSSRDDLELYQVVDLVEREDRIWVRTRYAVNSPDDTTYASWPIEEFLSHDTFGAFRVWVPNWILTDGEAEQANMFTSPMPEVGKRYTHQNGSTYRVLHIATREEDGTEEVVYVSETDERVWSRVVSDWRSLKNGRERFVEAV